MVERGLVTATKEQLESVGIDYDIMNLSGEIKGYYTSGYVQIEIAHTWNKLTFTNSFDIPSWWIQKIPIDSDVTK